MTDFPDLPPRAFIRACLLGDQLRARAAAGDLQALRILAALAPRDLPAKAWRQHRDAAIRAIADRLFATLPATTPHAMAGLLAAVGQHFDAQGRRMPAHVVRLLGADESARLEGEVRALLALAPGRRRWPSHRALEQLLGRKLSAE